MSEQNKNNRDRLVVVGANLLGPLVATAVFGGIALDHQPYRRGPDRAVPLVRVGGHRGAPGLHTERQLTLHGQPVEIDLAPQYHTLPGVQATLINGHLVKNGKP